MTTIEEHEKIAKELLEDINEKIRSNLLVDRQKIIGFAASEVATNLFAILLHKERLVEPGFNVNHWFFASKKIAEEKFSFNINKKEKILDLLVSQEDYRNKLCHGREKEAKIVNSAIKNLFELKQLIEGELNSKKEKNE